VSKAFKADSDTSSSNSEEAATLERSNVPTSPYRHLRLQGDCFAVSNAILIQAFL